MIEANQTVPAPQFSYRIGSFDPYDDSRGVVECIKDCETKQGKKYKAGEWYTLKEVHLDRKNFGHDGHLLKEKGPISMDVVRECFGVIREQKPTTI